MKEINLDDIKENADWIKDVPRMESEAIFLDAMKWLRDHYGEFRFFMERDVVWTVQNKITELIGGKPYKVFSEYSVFRDVKNSQRSDLVILNNHDEIEVVAEFKYEPNHNRKDIPKGKLKQPVVFWKEGVVKDIERLQRLKIRAKIVYAILIDEDGYFCERRPKPVIDKTKSSWRDWENGVKALWSKV